MLIRTELGFLWTSLGFAGSLIHPTTQSARWGGQEEWVGWKWAIAKDNVVSAPVGLNETQSGSSLVAD